MLAVMLIEVLKFIHVLVALGLLSFTSYCLILLGSKQFDTLTLFNKLLLYLSPLAMLTGTLLVHPKHYTFHTPWIQAAYLLLILFMSCIMLLTFKGKYKPAWLYQLIYFSLVLVLIVITHDAVRKATFLIAPHPILV
jgi:hypothetical protein